VPRPSVPLSEDRAPVSLGDRLDRVSSDFRNTGRLAANVRQGEGRDVPADRTNTRQRQETVDSFKAAFLHEVGETWSDFVAGFAERPDMDRPMQTLQQALSDYARAPGQFLRGESGFLSALTLGLRQGGAEALLRDLADALARVPGQDTAGQDYDTARISGDAAVYVAALTDVMVATVLGGVDRLPQEFLTQLREAGAEILRSDLSPSEKTDALCQLCKGAVCQHGIGPDLMLRGETPAETAAAKCFVVLLSTGETRNLSPDLAKALGPLVQSLPSRLEDFVGALGMPTVDG
jgi:hypothetical protein